MTRKRRQQRAFVQGRPGTQCVRGLTNCASLSGARAGRVRGQGRIQLMGTRFYRVSFGGCETLLKKIRPRHTPMW